ncbi:MAG: transposase [Streptosporangiaceae bacterium]
MSAQMRTILQAQQDWLPVVQMPAYAPGLNPVEGAWSTIKNSLGNLGSCGSPHRPGPRQSRLAVHDRP